MIIQSENLNLKKSVILLLGKDSDNSLALDIYTIAKYRIIDRYGVGFLTNDIFNKQINKRRKKLNLAPREFPMTEILRQSVPDAVLDNLPALVLYDGMNKAIVVEPLQDASNDHRRHEAIDALENYIIQHKCYNGIPVPEHKVKQYDLASFGPDITLAAEDIVSKRSALRADFVVPEEVKKCLRDSANSAPNYQVAYQAIIEFLLSEMKDTPQTITLIISANGQLRFKYEKDNTLTGVVPLTGKNLAIYHVFLKHPGGIKLEDLTLENVAYKREFNEAFDTYVGRHLSTYYTNMVNNSCIGLRSNISKINTELKRIGGCFVEPEFTITRNGKSLYYIPAAVSADRIINQAVTDIQE